jgi:hypothetical protein
MGRNILAVVLGVVLAGSLVFAVEALGHRIYPPPEGLKADDYEAIKEYVAQAPVGALLFVPLSWFVGTLAGCWLAGYVARPQGSWPVLIVGGLLLAMGVAMLVMIPSPAWFSVVGVAAFVAATFAGANLAKLSRAR